MDKVNKLNMFYNLEDAQGIRVVVNTDTTTSEHVPQETIVPTMIPSPTLIV